MSRIFPSDAAARELLDAAWNSYIVRCRPYSNVYPVLERQYRAAADRLGKSGADGRLARDPDERLAEHLLLFYAHGLIDISEGTNPVSLFFQHASDELRGHAIGFVGRTLRDDTEKELPKAVVARLQRLWEWRVGIAGENQPKQNHFAELTSFGWWFVCGKFPRKWALQHLQLVLKLVSWVEPDDNVVKELTEVAKTQPHAAVECLGRLVHGLKGWQPSWLGQAHDMLKVALQDEETQHDARRVVDRFGERGFINEFQDLGETDRQ